MLFYTPKPFLKWAGGKTQLISDIKNRIPKHFVSETFTYIEPFVGGGSVLFWVMNNFNVKRAIINDINPHLVNTYKTIKNYPNELVLALENLQKDFHSIENEIEKKEYYNQIRDLYNKKAEEDISQAAMFIFLNKTCFNGLYRVNRKGEYNVPMGRYNKPLICDRQNILAVSDVLQRVEITCGDFETTLDFAEKNTLFYLDPPYKPLNETSNFNAYSEFDFDDSEQIRLRDFCVKLNERNCHWILSNSDMKNVDSNNNFFDDLYSEFNIQRVFAKRSINSKAEKRGTLTELLIYNVYETY